MKEAFPKEEGYLNSHFQGIDVNLPFGKGDSAMAIAGKIAALRKEAIDDTRSLLDGETPILLRCAQTLKNIKSQ